jgi:beta-lactamase class A
MTSRPAADSEIETVLSDAFAGAAVDGHLLATDLRTGLSVAYAADEPVVLASVFKLAILVEMHRQHDAGELDLSEPVLVPVEGRSEGGLGLSVMSDPVTMSLRDLSWLMMAISDNAATDVICDRVRVSRINDTLRLLGLSRTVVLGSCRDLFDTVREDLGMDVDASVESVDLTDPAVLARLRAVDPESATRSTARDIAGLLSRIWDDRAASAASCAEMRRVLGQQVWPHRLAAGFPEDDVQTSGKTGTLPPWRNEAGVVEFPDGRAYAVAVFTRSRRPAFTDPAADAVIGRASRLAVDFLRRSR